MANSENLKVPTSEEAREYGRRGGLASAEARKQKKDLRMCLEMLLEKDITTKTGETISGAEAISAKLFEQALKGNIKAFETVRSTVGQDPVQKIMVSEVEQSVIDEVEAIVRGEAPKEESTKESKPESRKATAPKPKKNSGEVLKIDPDTGKVVARYTTAAEAARENGIDRSNLAKAIKNGKKAAGFKWEKKA